jgi:hypothetical protein
VVHVRRESGRHWLPALPGIGSRHLHSEKTVAGSARHAHGLDRLQLHIGIYQFAV